VTEVTTDTPPVRNPSKRTVWTDRPQFDEVREVLEKSHHPVILAGADVLRAGAAGELRELAHRIGAAVLATMDARGVFPESHPRWAGVYMGFFNPNVIETRVFDRADLVLLAGVDALMTHTLWNLKLPTCELTARPEYPAMSGSPTLRVNGDLKWILQELSVRARSGFPEAEIQAFRSDILRYFKRPAHARFAAQDIIQITRELLPKEGLLISETGAFICMLEHLWPVEQPGTYYSSCGGRTMGLTLPAVIGARLADPDRPMVGLGADGSLLMRLGELEVFARARIGVPLVIVNDQALGTMKSRQRSRGLPDFGLDLHDVDFSMVARACGLRGVTVSTPEDFRRELQIALQASQTTLIDARVDRTVYHDSFGPTIGVLNGPATSAEEVPK
jgi:acetolactate synthase-1/2/3 large subunit